jgi:integrase
MSAYFTKGKGWRYDFTLDGIRYTKTWFKTKIEAKTAESQRREELAKPQQETEMPTDMAFLELVNRRLDHVKAYNSKRHYETTCYLAKGWTKIWGNLVCGEVTQEMIEQHILKRKKVSGYTANKELRYLRSCFNFGLKGGLVALNPTEGLSFIPVEKKVRYIPSLEDIDKVISLADPDTQDYLWTIRETMARVSEVNRLTWDDVSLEGRYVILYTRKKRGGNLTPRKVPMTERLLTVMSQRYSQRDPSKRWVFWHRYWSKREGKMIEGPYQDRKKIMRVLCKKAKVRYFRFHPLRHSGASIMDANHVPMGVIQKILGHENRRTTKIYLHNIGGSDREAMAVYERARQISHTDSHTVTTA